MSQSITPPRKPGQKSISQRVAEDRETFEELADRDDQAGALARVMLAVADDESLDKSEYEAAGLPTLYKLREGA